jgi:hypothetical protein
MIFRLFRASHSVSKVHHIYVIRFQCAIFEQECDCSSSMAHSLMIHQVMLVDLTEQMKRCPGLYRWLSSTWPLSLPTTADGPIDCHSSLARPLQFLYAQSLLIPLVL